MAEDPEKVARVAAAICVAEPDSYGWHLQAPDRLQLEGVLEQIVPDVCLKKLPKKRWQGYVARAYGEMSQAAHDGEGRLQRLSRVLREAQQLRLFGAYTWLAQQVLSVP